MLRLHYHPTDASMAPHMLLEELGVPFTLALVDRANRAHKAPEYLRLNPNGLIPVLEDGEAVLFETAAILLHLADGHSAAGLAPPPGDALRPRFLTWLFWLSNSLHPTLGVFFYPERWSDATDARAVAAARAQAEARAGALLELLDQELARHGGPWLLGERYSALEPYALMLARWTRHFARPAREYPHLGPYLQRILARPAVQRAYATEGITEVLV